MNILVPIKRVVDPYVAIQMKPDGSGVQTEQVKMSPNPFDAIALEAAIQLKENDPKIRIQALTIGTQACQDVLRMALALGADEAVQIFTERDYEPINIAKIIAAYLRQQVPETNLILMGKQVIDGDHNQTAQYLAARLTWSQAMFASKITVKSDGLEVVREVDQGLETVYCPIPAVISADLRLNEPRYATLPNIMKAKKKPLKQVPLADLKLTLKTHTQQLCVEKPAERPPGIQVPDVAALMDALKNKVKLV